MCKQESNTHELIKSGSIDLNIKIFIIRYTLW